MKMKKISFFGWPWIQKGRREPLVSCLVGLVLAIFSGPSIRTRFGRRVIHYCLPIACQRGGVTGWVGVYHNSGHPANRISFPDALHYVFFMLPSHYLSLLRPFNFTIYTLVQYLHYSNSGPTQKLQEKTGKN